MALSNPIRLAGASAIAATLAITLGASGAMGAPDTSFMVAATDGEHRAVYGLAGEQKPDNPNSSIVTYSYTITLKGKLDRSYAGLNMEVRLGEEGREAPLFHEVIKIGDDGSYEAKGSMAVEQDAKAPYVSIPTAWVYVAEDTWGDYEADFTADRGGMDWAELSDNGKTKKYELNLHIDESTRTIVKL